MSNRNNKPRKNHKTTPPPPAAPQSSPIDDFVASSSPPSNDEQLAAAGSTASPPPCRTSGAEEKLVVDGVLTFCPTCGSTERTEYSNKRELPYEGTLPSGQKFNFVVWRDTRCANCLQRRCDRHHELRPSPRP